MEFMSRADVREYDRRAEAAGTPVRVLMERAGQGAAEILLNLGVQGRVVVCCAKGNNGGDGLVVARHLVAAGIDVSVLLFASPDELTGATAENWRSLLAAKIPAEVVWPLDEKRVQAKLDGAEWIVDAFFGIGVTSPLRPPFDRIVALINASPATVFAIDVPSGLDADTGEPLGPTIRAKHTATMVAPKRGFANPTSAVWTGKIHVVDLDQAPR